MANELLDFVMAVVGDPATAARYAADPARTLAEANLVDVTTADVDSLIPMVADTLPPALTGAVPTDANVWAGGAATAAFDAFGGVGVPGSAAGLVDPVIGQSDIEAAVADMGGAEPDVATADWSQPTPYGATAVIDPHPFPADLGMDIPLDEQAVDDATELPGHPADPSFDLF